MSERFLERSAQAPQVEQEIELSGLFDAQFYLSRCRDAEVTEGTALAHFVRAGLNDGTPPSACFDPALYLELYPDVAETGLPPLLHYLRRGRGEGRTLPDPRHAILIRAEALGLFDPAFYAAFYPGVARSGLSPREHYTEVGAAEGRRPSLAFNPRAYFAAHPDVAASEPDALVHYVAFGRREGRALPPPPFTVDELKAARELVAASDLFDGDFYLHRHPAASAHGADPVLHYLLEGAGTPPSARFDPAFYLELYPDVATAGLHPLLHYLRRGRGEGRTLPDPRHAILIRAETLGLFDPAFYAAFYPGVARSGLSPREHYAEVGAAEGRRPSLAFNPRAYFAAHPDVAASEPDALVHYVAFGRREGRALPPPPFTVDELKAARELVAASDLFDGDFYLHRHPAASAHGADPVLHYLLEGGEDWLDPSADFSTIDYVIDHPAVLARRENPLIHHLRSGEPDELSGTDPAIPRPDAGARSQSQAITIARMATGAYFGRFGFTFERKGSTAHVPDAVAELAGAKPKGLVVADAPEVSIIIPVYGQMPFTVSCLDALLHHRSRHSAEIILADDRSPAEERTELLASVPWIRYLRNPKNLGFLDNCNEAARSARGRFIVLLNSDTRVLDGWLDELIDHFSLFPKAGFVGSKLLNGDGTLQEAGGVYWSDGSAWNYGRGGDPDDPRYCFAREVDWVSGASVAVPTAVWREVGGFDTHFRPAYCEDVDLAFRIRDNGREVWYQPLSRVLHFEGMTHGRDETVGIKAYQVANLKKLQRRWKGRLPGRRPGGSEPDREATRARDATMLVLDATYPRPDQDAGSLIAVQIMQAYRDLGLHQTFVPVDGFSSDARYAADLQRVGVEVLHAPFQTTMADVLSQHRLHFDYVLIFRYGIAQRAIELLRSALPDARILFSNVDLHFLRMEREAALRDIRSLRIAAARAQTDELSVFAKVDSSIVHTPVERDEVLSRVPVALDNIVVLPWVSNVQPSEADMDERWDTMFLGGFPHAPNVDAVLFFVEEVWPRLVGRLPDDAKFLAVGNAPPDRIRNLASERVIVTGLVPFVEPYFAKARVFVAPLRFGAGIKGKVIQALANGVPVVASTVAVEGIGLSDGVHCITADTPDAIATAVLRLYAEPDTWSRLRDAGHRFVEQNFSQAAAVSICRRSLDVADATWMRRENRRRSRLLTEISLDGARDLDPEAGLP